MDLSGLSTYELNGYRKGDEHPAYAPEGHGTLYLTFTSSWLTAAAVSADSEKSASTLRSRGKDGCVT